MPINNITVPVTIYNALFFNQSLCRPVGIYIYTTMCVFLWTDIWSDCSFADVSHLHLHLIYNETWFIRNNSLYVFHENNEMLGVNLLPRIDLITHLQKPWSWTIAPAKSIPLCPEKCDIASSRINSTAWVVRKGFRDRYPQLS